MKAATRDRHPGSVVASSVFMVASLLLAMFPGCGSRGSAPAVGGPGARTGQAEKPDPSVKALDTQAPAASAEKAEGVSRERDEEDAREAVFRSLMKLALPTFQKWHKDAKSHPVFIAFEEDADPLDGFLARFADLGLSLRKASLCHIPTIVKDKQTQEEGILLRLLSFEMQSDGTASAKGDCIYGLSAGESWDFTAKRVKGRWIAEDTSNGVPQEIY